MKLEILFPEACNLYGDLMNIEYLSRSIPGAEVVKTPLKAEPLFLDGGVSLVYMGTMTEKAQEYAAEALMPHRERIAELINNGQVFLITGNALEIFGTRIEGENGGIDCLGIFDTCARRDMLKRHNSLFLGKFEDMEIVGFKSQFSHSYGDNSRCFLFEKTRGTGLSPGNRFEGLRKNNFLATYLLGPLLPLNPPFTGYILRLLGAEDAAPAFDGIATEAYIQRIDEFKRLKKF
jgi:CobQ-like glutamine amidotransferase family enzyme